MTSFPDDLEGLNALGQGMLPGVLGLRFTQLAYGRVSAELDVAPMHLAPNGFLHAATVIALADTSCGYGCMASRPPDVDGFTTLELKTNFLGTQTDGLIRCEAAMLHGGRTTQIWDAVVTGDDGDRQLAAFRCTQLLLRR